MQTVATCSCAIVDAMACKACMQTAPPAWLCPQGAAALVGRRASTVQAAADAAADGANFVLLAGPAGRLPDASLLEAARSAQRSGSAIPVIAGCGGAETGAVSADSAVAQAVQALLGSKVDGLALGLGQLALAASAVCGEPPAGAAGQAEVLLQVKQLCMCDASFGCIQTITLFVICSYSSCYTCTRKLQPCSAPARWRVWFWICGCKDGRLFCAAGPGWQAGGVRGRRARLRHVSCQQQRHSAAAVRVAGGFAGRRERSAAAGEPPGWGQPSRG